MYRRHSAVFHNIEIGTPEGKLWRMTTGFKLFLRFLKILPVPQLLSLLEDPDSSVIFKSHLRNDFEINQVKL